jgi:hypothetical protein
VRDGFVGHHNALSMARQRHLQLMSTRRGGAALYRPYTGPYAGRGLRRTYDSKVDDANISEKYLKETTMEGYIHTHLSQAQLLHKEFAHPLNIVIMSKPTCAHKPRPISSCSAVI